MRNTANCSVRNEYLDCLRHLRQPQHTNPFLITRLSKRWWKPFATRSRSDSALRRCEFQTRCRQKAEEKDDLSLLSGMTEKERRNLHDKGILTVTQLS